MFRRRTVVIVALSLLLAPFALSTPGSAFCLFSCEPSEANAQQVFENVVRARVQAPVSVSNFRKTNGAKISFGGMEGYEIQFVADVDFPQGFVRRPNGVFEEIQLNAEGNNRVLSLRDLGNWKPKLVGRKFWEPVSFSMAGTVSFQKTEKGWQGIDGRVY
jgi:hypothetical protein